MHPLGRKKYNPASVGSKAPLLKENGWGQVKK